MFFLRVLIFVHNFTFCENIRTNRLCFSPFYVNKPEELEGGGSERRQYDSVVIEAEDTVEYAYFSVRRFRVTDLSAAGGSRQYVMQYHYHRWRLYDSENGEDLVDGFDHLAFIDFYFHVKMATRLEDGPILVHCEDGKWVWWLSVMYLQYKQAITWWQ